MLKNQKEFITIFNYKYNYLVFASSKHYKLPVCCKIETTPIQNKIIKGIVGLDDIQIPYHELIFKNCVIKLDAKPDNIKDITFINCMEENL